MFIQAIGQFVEGQAYIFKTDFLAMNGEWHGRKTMMHGSPDTREDGTIADASVKNTNRWRGRGNVFQLASNALTDDPFF